MISYSEALEIILSQVKPVKTIFAPTIEAYGAVLAADLCAPIALPSFNNSAMDGYALLSSKTQNASREQPRWFDKVSTIGAGDKTNKTYQAHQTTEIMTGAPLPKAFDAVVPVEHTQTVTRAGVERVGIETALQIGENIRFRGEDIDQGELLLSKGTRLTHEHIMTLSGVGMHDVEIFKPPSVLVLATGKELSVNQKAILDHQIYDCNSPYLSSCLRHQWQASVYIEHLLTDTETPFCELLERYLSRYPDLDMIISTGAVSAGKYDFIPRALERLQAKILFHKVAIRPGKPVLFAMLLNGTAYFGLPGNPSAVACGKQFFIDPFLSKQRSIALNDPIPAILDNTVSYQKALCFFQKAYHYVDSEGQSRVQILPGQASFMISPFLKANSWVKIDTAPTTLQKGEPVTVYRMAR